MLSFGHAGGPLALPKNHEPPFKDSENSAAVGQKRSSFLIRNVPDGGVFRRAFAGRAPSPGCKRRKALHWINI
jgi:hypothetical protein